ncbi:hypothetical protein SAMN04515695_3021 [Pseudovibrio sp. Tun.PSC04-5.I4]|nr:hypothetical protein SAMN04515695_3021 [Pseudovibrio sp. Tun.PSC04-5.I4]
MGVSPDEEAVMDDAYRRDKLKTKAVKIAPIDAEVDGDGSENKILPNDVGADADEAGVVTQQKAAGLNEKQVKVLSFDRNYQTNNVHAARTIRSFHIS